MHPLSFFLRKKQKYHTRPAAAKGQRRRAPTKLPSFFVLCFGASASLCKRLPDASEFLKPRGRNFVRKAFCKGVSADTELSTFETASAVSAGALSAAALLSAGVLAFAPEGESVLFREGGRFGIYLDLRYKVLRSLREDRKRL